VNMVRCYESLNARNKAIAYLEELRAKYPDNLLVVDILGELYFAEHELGKAKKLYTGELQRLPNNVSFYLELARIEALLRNSPEAAKEIYLQGLQKNPDDVRLLLALASYYEQTGEKGNAISIYEGLIDKHPEADVAINNLATILVESASTDDVSRGLELVKKFKDSEQSNFVDTYAWALIKTGQTSAGLKILEALIVKEPKVPVFRYHLAVAHFNSGNKATAIAELKQAFSLSEKQHRNFNGMGDAKKLLQELDKDLKK